MGIKAEIQSSDNASSYEDNNFYMLGIIDDNTEKLFYEFATKKIEPELQKMPSARKPIKIHISSPGGYVQEALAILGLIEHYKAKDIVFETHVRSIAASAATFIAIAGTEGHRYINPYATFMIHQLSGGAIGELKYMNDRMKFNNYTWKQVKKIYKKYTDITEEKLNDIYEGRKDWYINPTYAKKLHIVDHIL